ncbi:MAG: hypothetical protein ACREXY_06195, partial [Gammaproteobacteria bacterium]
MRTALRKSKLFEDAGTHGRDGARQLRTFMNEMMPGFNRIAQSRLPLITHLLSLLDHAITSGYSVLPGRSVPDLERFRNLLEWAILDILYWPYTEGKEPTLLLD